MHNGDPHAGMTTTQVFYTEWKRYQEHLKRAIAPLNAEQLLLRAAPTLRPLWVNIAHIIATRVWWFNKYLQENDPQIAPLMTWDDPGEPERSAAELVGGLDTTWRFMQDRLNRWTPDDMARTFPPQGRDDPYLSRNWVVWHVLEHDLHHGGEVSIMLGMHGLQALDI